MGIYDTRIVDWVSRARVSCLVCFVDVDAVVGAAVAATVIYLFFLTRRIIDDAVALVWICCAL